MTTPAIIIQQRQPTIEITQTSPQTIIARIPVATGGGGGVWGGIAGTLADQTDLKNALDAKALTTHNHTGTYEPANTNIQSHITSTTNPHSVTATQVGAEPFGTVTTHAALTNVHGLSNKADLVGGFVPSSQLPSLVALGETSTTAYRGDRGKTAYDHSQAAHAPTTAEQNVQADWNQAVNTEDDYIKNKPSIPSVSGLLNEAAHDALDHTGLPGIPATYAHPTGDGNLHVPATSTTNSGKVLIAGATAGALSWETLAAPVGTDYTTQRLRNIKLMTTTPVAGDFDGNGSIIGVYTP